MKKLLIGVVVILLLILSYYYEDISKTLNTANGFSAKNLCSAHYNSGYQFDDVMEQALLPVNPAFSLVSYEHDESSKTIHTSVAGLFSRQAQYRPGLGCTLLGVEQEVLTGQITPVAQTVKSSSIPWPEGAGPVVKRDNLDYSVINKAIDDAFAEPYPEGRRNTKAVLVIHQGELIAERYAAPISRQTPSLSWSMAKSVTNLLLGTLVHKGKLDIDKPAPVSDWQDENDPRSALTTDILLRMSSGLSFNETYGINTDVSHMLSNVTSASNYAMSMPLAHEPDTHWSYSSGTTNILARILFDTIGGDLQDQYDYAQSALFGPLGLDQAIMETDGSNVFIGSSYFYTTPGDWARLGQFVLQDGVWKGERLLPEGWVDYSSTPTPVAPKREYGAQFWLNAKPPTDDLKSVWPSLPHDIFYMGGYQGQFVIISPSLGLVVVRLGYTSPGTDKGIEKLVAGIIKGISSGQN